MLFDVNFSRCHRLTCTIAVIMISWKYLALTIICSVLSGNLLFLYVFLEISIESAVHRDLYTMDYGCTCTESASDLQFLCRPGYIVVPCTMGFSTQVHDHARVICLKGGLSRSVWGILHSANQGTYGLDNGKGVCLNSKIMMPSKGRIIVMVLKSDHMFEMYWYCSIISGTNSNTR